MIFYYEGFENLLLYVFSLTKKCVIQWTSIWIQSILNNYLQFMVFQYCNWIMKEINLCPNIKIENLMGLNNLGWISNAINHLNNSPIVFLQPVVYGVMGVVKVKNQNWILCSRTWGPKDQRARIFGSKKLFFKFKKLPIILKNWIQEEC